MTPWTIAQTPLSMDFCSQEYWSGLHFLSPGDLPFPWIKPRPPALQADSLLSEPPGKPHTHTHTHTRIYTYTHTYVLCKTGGLDGKKSTCDAGDLGSIPELGRSPGEGNDNPLQYSCLENFMDR